MASQNRNETNCRIAVEARSAELLGGGGRGTAGCLADFFEHVVGVAETRRRQLRRRRVPRRCLRPTSHGRTCGRLVRRWSWLRRSSSARSCLRSTCRPACRPRGTWRQCLHRHTPPRVHRDNRVARLSSSRYTSSVNSFSAASPAAVASGIAGKRAGVEHRAQRRQRLHDLASAADRADRQTSADDLAERRQIRA